MKIFSKYLGKFYYYFDHFKSSIVPVQTDHFQFDNHSNCIIVVYRLGRQKLLNKMDIQQFNEKYFSMLSNIDQLRVNKFYIMQNILNKLFHNNIKNCKDMINYIKDEINNEHTF